MSKSSNKKKLKQLMNWISGELKFNKGAVRVINSSGYYIKIKKNV